MKAGTFIFQYWIICIGTNSAARYLPLRRWSSLEESSGLHGLCILCILVCTLCIRFILHPLHPLHPQGSFFIPQLWFLPLCFIHVCRHKGHYDGKFARDIMSGVVVVGCRCSLQDHSASLLLVTLTVLFEHANTTNRYRSNVWASMGFAQVLFLFRR